MPNRAGHLAWLAILLCLVAILTGCGPKTIHIDSGIGDPADYGLLLHRIVVEDKIDVAALLENQHLLDRYLAWLFQTGTGSISERDGNTDGLLAHLINYHNALMLRSLVALASNDGLPEKLPADLDRRFQFSIGGGRSSPVARSEGVRAFVLTAVGGDWRVRLALYSGRMDGPPLPPRPFLPNLLDAQLDAVVRAALNSEQVVRIDHGSPKQLLLWRGLYDIRQLLIEDYQRRMHTTDATMLSVLLEWSDPFRRETLNSAVGYPVVAMPRDHRINARPPTPNTGQSGK